MPEDNLIVCDTPESIRMFSLLSMRGRLKLEMKGMRFKPARGMTTASAVKEMFGLPRNCRNAKALLRLNEEIEVMKMEKALNAIEEGDECPFCTAGTVEFVDDEMRCRGECGAVAPLPGNIKLGVRPDTGGAFDLLPKDEGVNDGEST